jgi:hypothetical protein
MNAHDSERIKGMLEELGLGEAVSTEDADVVVFNTCTIREQPDTKLAAYLNAEMLSSLRPGEGDRRRRLLRGSARSPRSTSTCSWTSRSGRARSRTAEWPGGQAPRPVQHRRRAQFAGTLPDAPRAALPGLGSGLDGLQLGVLVLHRAVVAAAGEQAPARSGR